jgi:hypothetical protein
MRCMTWRTTDLVDIALRIIGRYSTQETRVQMRCITWRTMSLANICSPHHRSLFNSRNEGSNKTYDVADNGPSKHCSLRHRSLFNTRNEAIKCVG